MYKTLLQITDFFESSLTLDIDVSYIFIHRVTTTVPLESSAVFVIICPVGILRPYTCFYPSTIGHSIAGSLPLYRLLLENCNCHGISRQMKIFYMVKLLYSGKRHTLYSNLLLEIKQCKRIICMECLELLSMICP